MGGNREAPCFRTQQSYVYWQVTFDLGGCDLPHVHRQMSSVFKQHACLAGRRMDKGMKNRLLTFGRRRAALPVIEDIDNPATLSDFNFVPDGHLVVTGGTGRGKTCILAAMAEAACREMDVYVADPWLPERDVFAARPSAIAGKASTLPEIAELLEGLRDIALARAEATRTSVAGRDRPVLLVLDEGSIFQSDEGTSRDIEARKRCLAAIELISAHAEAAEITVLLAAQGSPKQCLDLLKGDPSRISILDLGTSLHVWDGEDLYTTRGTSPAYIFDRRQGVYTRGSKTPEVVNIPVLAG